MDRQEAIDRLLEHYQNPQHYGALEGADVVTPGGQPNCGDVVTIYLKVDQNGHMIQQLQFEGKGCTISQAAASILAGYAVGRSLAEIQQFDSNQMFDLLGREVVINRPRCATLALNTLKLAIADYYEQRARAAHGRPIHEQW